MLQRPQTCSAVVAASLLLWACGGGPAASATETRAERVLLITCDTLRADRLGVYGFEAGTSPNLDAFAEECLVYDKAYAAAPMTMPSFASMMTGLLPDHTGVLNNHVLIPAQATTIAESLSAAGFATSAVVSNWVLKSRDVDKQRGMEQGFDDFDDTMQSAERTRKKVKERLAPDTTDAALAWLEERPSDRFFLWVHYQDPHGPYTPPEEYIEERNRAYARQLPLSNRSNTAGNIPFYQVLGQEMNTDFYEDRYEAEIRYFDRELGRLLAALEEEDLLEQALVIFTADHGESLGEHDWWFSHGQTLYAELVRVPLLIRFPGALPQVSLSWEGDYRRSEALVGHVDLYATILASVGLAASKTHGLNLLEPAFDSQRVICQSVWELGEAKRWQSATDGRWRWLKNQAAEMLFDLEADPKEETNRIASHPGEAQRLRAAFQSQRESLGALGARATQAASSAEDEANMQALGYGGMDEEDEDSASPTSGDGH